MNNFMMNTQLKIMIIYIASELIFFNPFQKGNESSAGLKSTLTLTMLKQANKQTKQTSKTKKKDMDSKIV